MKKLAMEIKVKEDVKFEYNCHLCNEKFEFEENLKDHLKFHSM